MSTENIHDLYDKNDEVIVAAFRLFFINRCDACYCDLSSTPQIRKAPYTRKFSKHKALLCNKCGLLSRKNMCHGCLYIFRKYEIEDGMCPQCNIIIPLE